MRRLMAILMVSLFVSCMGSRMAQAQVELCDASDALFSKAAEDWKIAFYEIDDTRDSVCILGKMTNDNDCKARIPPPYPKNDALNAFILHAEEGNYEISKFKVRCLCLDKPEPTKNQYFICQVDVDKSIVEHAIDMRVEDEDYTPAVCAGSQRYEMPKVSSGIDANSDCIKDADEETAPPQGGPGAGGGGGEDSDGDNVPDSDDNCPDLFNPLQADEDDDGVGDLCEQSAAPPADTSPPPGMDEGGGCSLIRRNN